MKSTGTYPRLHVAAATIPAVGQVGGILLTETIRVEPGLYGPVASDPTVSRLVALRTGKCTSLIVSVSAVPGKLP